MREWNITAIVLGLTWVIASYSVIRIILASSPGAFSVVFVVSIIILPPILISTLFENILKYDFFNKDYKSDRKNK
ncbi:hypothetical protein ACFFLE_03310 [Salinicoccus siamensis]|uniref:Uncharacterized protein n=3 Tax=Salinicoccus TaxID=45669 RepID=A0ABV5Z559_9STAP